MSLDSIPTRANGAEIDNTWFNVLQAVLGADVVPRTAGGVPTDIAGNLGTLTYAWTSLLAVTAYLRANGHKVGLQAPGTLAADLTLTLPGSLPSALSALTIDASGNIAFGAAKTAVQGTSSGALTMGTTFGTIAATPSMTTNGGAVLIQLQPDQSATASLVSLANNNGTFATCQFKLLRDGVAIAFLNIVLDANKTMSFPAGAFTFIDPAPSAGAHTYTLQGLAPTGVSGELQYVVLFGKEL